MVVGFKCGDTLGHHRYNRAAVLLQSGYEKSHGKAMERPVPQPAFI
jgi:hypothetical protein